MVLPRGESNARTRAPGNNVRAQTPANARARARGSRAVPRRARTPRDPRGALRAQRTDLDPHDRGQYTYRRASRRARAHGHRVLLDPSVDQECTGDPAMIEGI